MEVKASEALIWRGSAEKDTGLVPKPGFARGWPCEPRQVNPWAHRLSAEERAAHPALRALLHSSHVPHCDSSFQLCSWLMTVLVGSSFRPLWAERKWSPGSCSQPGRHLGMGRVAEMETWRPRGLPSFTAGRSAPSAERAQLREDPFLRFQGEPGKTGTHTLGREAHETLARRANSK